MTLRRMNVHEFWKPSEVPPEQYYQNLQKYQQYQNLPLLSRKLGSGYNYTQDSFSLKKPESSLKRRIARTQSDRRAGPSEHQHRFSLTLDRRGRIPEYENLANYNYKSDHTHHHRSCSDLTNELKNNQVGQSNIRPNIISISCHNINQDLEYGPGIVEKLRAKFSRFSGANQQQNDEVRHTSVNKKFSSFEDLLADNNSDSNRSQVNSQPIEFTRRASRSISDMVATDNSSDFEKPVIPLKPATLLKPEVKEEQQEEVRSIIQLRRRFEKHGDQAAKMRFARDPVELITKVNPSYVAPQYKPQPKPASNILKILNDAESTPSEPEFVQIARRLRRFQPEVHESSQKSEIGIKLAPPPTPTTVEPLSTKVPVTWHRRQPEIPNLTESAKIIRESCDITSVLPPDPHSARVSKQPIPPIVPEVSRSTVLIESSPPPEEPKPTVSEQFSQFRKTVVDISSDKSSIANSVFKYENPPTKPSFNNNFWKTDDQEKISFVGRKIEDISAKSIITSQNSQLPNVVSITVKGPSRINSNFSTYDTAANINSPVEDKNEEINKKPPTTYSPSYISLSTKYMEDKKHTAVQSSLNGLLSPREKPYGDDVTILKTDASNTCKTDDAILLPVNTNHLTTTTTITNQDDFEECSSSSSDNDSQDGTGSYDVTPLRPNSLMLTRLANEEEVGGDGNLITRSLISLVAEEDLPDFLVALNEKPVRYTFVEESEKPSTSSILRVTLNGSKKNTSNSSNRIRFCTATPLAYAYSDEITAIRSLQWDDGTIVEYSYFKELEERELQNDPTMSLIHQWEQQLANSTLPDPSFTEALIESTLSSAY